MVLTEVSCQLNPGSLWGFFSPVPTAAHHIGKFLFKLDSTTGGKWEKKAGEHIPYFDK